MAGRSFPELDDTEALAAAVADPSCLVDTEALVIDGANGVCRAARSGELPSAAGLCVHALGFVVVLLATRRAFDPGPRRVPRVARFAFAAVLALGMIAAAVPGWTALARTRADAPARRAVPEREIAALLSAVDAFAAVHPEGVALESERCVACQPIARMAVAVPAPASTARAVFERGALGGTCEVRGATLRCGASSP